MDSTDTYSRPYKILMFILKNTVNTSFVLFLSDVISQQDRVDHRPHQTANTASVYCLSILV